MGGDEVYARLQEHLGVGQRRDDRRRPGHPRAPRVQRGLRLRARDDGQLGVLRRHDARAGRRGRGRPAGRHAGAGDPRRAGGHLEGDRAGPRRLPGRPRRRGPDVGPASRLGLQIARERGWHAPEPRPPSSPTTTSTTRRRRMTDLLTPVLTANWGDERAWKLVNYERTGGYQGAAHRAGDGPRRRRRPGEGRRAARPRRRGLPDGHEVGVHPAGQPEAQVPRGQRRRVRAGHLQGHPADDGLAAHPRRGRDHLGLRHPLPHRVHLRPRRGRARGAPAPAGGPRGLLRGLRRARTSWAPATTSRSSCTPARAPTSAARRRRCSTRSRAGAASRGCGRRSPRSPGSTPARR